MTEAVEVGELVATTFRRVAGERLLAYRLGRLAESLGCTPEKAASIVYAERDIACLSILDWPDWAADLPMAGSKIQAGEPVCTVYASDAAAEAAMELAEKRRQTVLSWTRARNR